MLKCRRCYAEVYVFNGKWYDFDTEGFLNNNLDLIKDGVKLVKEGNELYSSKELITKNLPENKKHMANVAENASKESLKILLN